MTDEMTTGVEGMAQAAGTEIRALEDRWIACYLRGDTAGFAALLDDAFVYSSERGVFRKAEYVENLASGRIEMRGLRNTELHVLDHGGAVVAYGTVAMDASFDGRDISGTDRFTRVWTRKEGRWVAVALHASAEPKG